jgi:hypothetical protein
MNVVGELIKESKKTRKKSVVISLKGWSKKEEVLRET